MSLERDLNELGRMSPAELRAKWRDVFRKSAPSITPELMARAIAYRLQERRYGGLQSSVRNQIARLARRAQKTGAFEPPSDISLKPGTQLIREWRGRTIKVVVRDDGFECDGRQYGSLSQISREVTGMVWSGPRFFGLRFRKAPPARGGSDA